MPWAVRAIHRAPFLRNALYDPLAFLPDGLGSMAIPVGAQKANLAVSKRSESFAAPSPDSYFRLRQRHDPALASAPVGEPGVAALTKATHHNLKSGKGLAKQRRFYSRSSAHQLGISPLKYCAPAKWWAQRDSNPRPSDYESLG
jgi:hypothetical protein